jgi:Zn finger protein HypA/HybF involved in hydrogenase expression
MAMGDDEWVAFRCVDCGKGGVADLSELEFDGCPQCQSKNVEILTDDHEEDD